MHGAALSVPQRAGAGSLIETKLHVPAVRAEWVQRGELVGYLASCASCRLVLVDAPAGFGKTTAVAQWGASVVEDRPFAWVSLDRGDDDPVRLWSHVVCALQRACPQFSGGNLLRSLRAQLPDVSGKVLPNLVNELAALRAPAVLVLDDYHVISDDRCHDQVAFLLSHLPAAVQLTAWPDGADAQRARLHKLERRLALSLRPQASEPLTQREVVVLRLLSGTMSLREIGRELYLSLNTVKTHARAVYRKLGVSTRQDAVAVGHDAGIL